MPLETPTLLVLFYSSWLCESSQPQRAGIHPGAEHVTVTPQDGKFSSPKARAPKLVQLYLVEDPNRLNLLLKKKKLFAKRLGDFFGRLPTD